MDDIVGTPEVTSGEGPPGWALPPPVPGRVSSELAGQLVDEARAEGLELVGPGGLLGELTKRVIEASLEAEMDDHLGYAKHDAAGRDGANSRNGTRSKTVLTDVVCCV